MKSKYLLVALCFCCQMAMGQQTNLFSFYRQNWQFLSPAMPNWNDLQGCAQYFTLNAAYRQQWIGYKGSPANYLVSFENMLDPTYRASPVKWGFGVYGDHTDILSSNGAYANYAYTFLLDRRLERKFHIGLNFGVMQQRLNFDGVRFHDNVPNDQLLTAWRETPNRLYADVNVGAAYTYGRDFYVALSAPQLINLGFSGGSNVFTPLRRQHINFLVGGAIQNFHPSLWVRWVPRVSYSSIFENNPISADLNVRYQIENRRDKILWLGLGASTSKWLHVEVGIPNIFKQKKRNGDYQMSVGLAYDLPMSPLGASLGQTVELNVGFTWE